MTLNDYDEREAAQRAFEAIIEARHAGVPAAVMALLSAPASYLTLTPARNAVREFMVDAPGTLILAGPVGTGKTVAACSAFLRQRGLFVRAAHLSRLGWFDEDAWRPYERAALLVVDDLGTEYFDAKGGGQAQWETFFDLRHSELRRTICTTNLTADEFKSRYSEKWRDRLAERGAFVCLTGQSMRREVPMRREAP